MTKPMVTIRFSPFLDPIFEGWIRGQEQYKGWIKPDKADVIRNIERYRSLWQKYGDKILDGLTSVTGLSFKRNLIPIYVVSGNPRSHSEPIVVKSTYNDTDFINTVIHELTHALYSDNCCFGQPTCTSDGVKWRYPHENSIVSKHVLIDAVLKAIYLDVLNEPERLEADIKNCSTSKLGYNIAWDIVQKEGYKEIIAEYNK